MKHPVRLYRWSFDMEDHICYRPCGKCELCEAGKGEQCVSNPGALHWPRATARDVIVAAETVVRVQIAACDTRTTEVIQTAGGSAFVNTPVAEVMALVKAARAMEPNHDVLELAEPPVCPEEHAMAAASAFEKAHPKVAVLS